jgi:hypothetical protein
MSGGHTSPPHFYTVVKQASSPGTILIIPLSWLSVDKTMAAHSSQAHRLQETPRLAPQPTSKWLRRSFGIWLSRSLAKG